MLFINNNGYILILFAIIFQIAMRQFIFIATYEILVDIFSRSCDNITEKDPRTYRIYIHIR